MQQAQPSHREEGEEHSHFNRDSSSQNNKRKLSLAMRSFTKDRTWGPLNIGLFASRLTYQLDQYVSWRPDPQASFTDAFTLDWSKFRAYAFPPFALILTLPSTNSEAECTLPRTSSSSMDSPTMASTSIRSLYRLPSPISNPELLTQGTEPHPLEQLQLAGWLLSTDPKTCFHASYPNNDSYLCAHAFRNMNLELKGGVHLTPTNLISYSFHTLNPTNLLLLQT
ncbi:hypothetical protein AC249_AIPGENE16964 [Exaiptasia diaphana]|nr:hypothetical protein AC249_AIPGENE16964 [Exaiptasia diaphana]